jgi:glycosyltransferase involved in cell wall biosynthesis
MSKLPKILFFEGNADGTVGGSYFSLLFLVEALDRSKYTPVIAFRREIPFIQRFRDAGFDVRVRRGYRPFDSSWLESPLLKRLGPLRSLCHRGMSALNIAKFFGVSVPASMAFLLRNGISLVHANNSVTSNHELFMAALLLGVPVITHERGIKPQFPALTRFCARRLSRIICISEAVRSNLTEHGVGAQNLCVIYNAVDPARVQPRRLPDEMRTSLGMRPGQAVVVMTGNVRRWKGQDVLIRALRPIADRYPETVALLVGDAKEYDRPYIEELRRLIDERRLDANVRFLGYQENVADFVNLADVAVHASVLPEPFGRVILEAMAVRKPIVGARAGGVPELIVEGETGYTFEPGNWEELAARVIDLLEDPLKARAMGEAGYRRLTRVFSIHEQVTKTEAVYEEVLAGGGRRTARSTA